MVWSLDVYLMTQRNCMNKIQFATYHTVKKKGMHLSVFSVLWLYIFYRSDAVSVAHREEDQGPKLWSNSQHELYDWSNRQSVIIQCHQFWGQMSISIEVKCW